MTASVQLHSPQAALHELRQSALLGAALLDRIEERLKAGGSLTNHLHHAVGDAAIGEVWQALAARSGRQYIGSPGDAGPIDVRLLSAQDALDFLVVPRVRRFTAVHLVTPDPFARLGDYAELRTRFTGALPGQPVQLRLDVAPPGTFRELFSLAYPTLRSAYRDARDAAVLASLLPRRAQARHRPTPEEAAAALATYRGLPYLDPELDPPDADVMHEQPFGPFFSRRLYPHSNDERGRMVVLGSVQTDLGADLDALLGKLQDLQDALQTPLVLTLCSTRRLVTLFRPHIEGAKHAQHQP